MMNFLSFLHVERPQKCCTEFLATQKHAGCPLGVRDDIFSGLKIENHGNSWQNHGYHGFQWFQLFVSFPDISWPSLTLELQEMQIMGRVNQFEPKIENLVGVVCESSGIPQVAIKTHEIFGSSQMFRHAHACTRFARMKVAHLKSCLNGKEHGGSDQHATRHATRPATRIPNRAHPDVGQIEPHVFLCWIRNDKNISYIWIRIYHNMS